MTEITVITPMTVAEAREKISGISLHLEEGERHYLRARRYLLELDRRDGWKALGYTSLRQCLEKELSHSVTHCYRLLQAAEVDAAIETFSPMGESVTVPERHARELAKLPQEKQYVAYDRAKTLAITEGVGQPTQRHVEKAVATVEAEMQVQDNPVIAHAVAAGEITPADGVKLHNALTALPPQHQANVMTLMTEHGLRDANLVVPLAEMSTRPADKLSKTFEEIQRTGHVAGVPLAQATLTDLKKLREEAQREHVSEAIEQKRMKAIEEGTPLIEPKVITVYVGDPEKTFKALRQSLSTKDLLELANLLVDYSPVSKEFWLNQQWFRQTVDEDDL